MPRPLPAPAGDPVFDGFVQRWESTSLGRLQAVALTAAAAEAGSDAERRRTQAAQHALHEALRRNADAPLYSALQRLAAAERDYRVGVQANIAALLAANAAIEPANRFEANEKQVNALYLARLGQLPGTWNAGEQQALLELAMQPLDEAGLAAATAWGLLPEARRPVVALEEEYARESEVDPAAEPRVGARGDRAPADGLQIAPNPTAGVFTLRFATQQRGTVDVFDLAGRRCHEAALAGTEVTIDVSGKLAPGIYAVRCRLDDGQVFSAKLVIQ
jgi:hypothetical protein